MARGVVLQVQTVYDKLGGAQMALIQQSVDRDAMRSAHASLEAQVFVHFSLPLSLSVSFSRVVCRASEGARGCGSYN